VSRIATGTDSATLLSRASPRRRRRRSMSPRRPAARLFPAKMIPREELTSPCPTAASGRSASRVRPRPPRRRPARRRRERGRESRDDLADLGQLLGAVAPIDQTDVVVAVPRPRAPRRARRGSPEASSRSCRSPRPGSVRQRTNTPLASRSRNGWRESRPRYGFTVIASARSSAAAYCRVVLPMSALGV